MKKPKTKKTCKFCNKTKSVDKFYGKRRLCKGCYYWQKERRITVEKSYVDQVYVCRKCKKPNTLKDKYGNINYELNKVGGKVCIKCKKLKNKMGVSK